MLCAGNAVSHKKGHFEVICQQKVYSKKLHSSEDSLLECSTAKRVPDYYDTTGSPVFLGFLEVIHMIEPETQDQQEEVMQAFPTEVKKSLYIDLHIENKLHAENLTTVWLKVDTGTSANLMSMEVFQKLSPG